MVVAVWLTAVGMFWHPILSVEVLRMVFVSWKDLFLSSFFSCPLSCWRQSVSFPKKFFVQEPIEEFHLCVCLGLSMQWGVYLVPLSRGFGRSVITMTMPLWRWQFSSGLWPGCFWWYLTDVSVTLTNKFLWAYYLISSNGVIPVHLVCLLFYSFFFFCRGGSSYFLCGNNNLYTYIEFWYSTCYLSVD